MRETQQEAFAIEAEMQKRFTGMLHLKEAQRNNFPKSLTQELEVDADTRSHSSQGSVSNAEPSFNKTRDLII